MRMRNGPSLSLGLVQPVEDVTFTTLPGGWWAASATPGGGQDPVRWGSVGHTHTSLPGWSHCGAMILWSRKNINEEKEKVKENEENEEKGRRRKKIGRCRKRKK